MGSLHSSEGRPEPLSELAAVAESRRGLGKRPPRQQSSSGLLVALCVVLLLLGGVATALVMVLTTSRDKPPEQADTPTKHTTPPAAVPPAPTTALAAAPRHKPPVVRRLLAPPTARVDSARVASVQAGVVNLRPASNLTSGNAPRSIFDFGDDATHATPGEPVFAVVLQIENPSDAPVEYVSYNTQAAAQLKDPTGRVLHTADLAAYEPVIRCGSKKTLAPGEKIEDTIVFVLPAKTASHYDLVLPGQNLRSSTPVTVSLDKIFFETTSLR